MKKFWILLSICTLSLPLFTACTSNADTMPQNSPTASNPPAATTTVSPSSSTSPMDQMTPSVTDSTGTQNMGAVGAMTDTVNNGGINTVEDALRVSEQISDEVEKLSEVESAEAVVAGNIAIVGVEYDSQYQGGMTDRLKDMVTERVEMVDKAVTSVHVTDSKETVAMVKELYKKVESAGITFDELQTQLLNLGSTITGGGSPQVSQPQSNTAGSRGSRGSAPAPHTALRAGCV